MTAIVPDPWPDGQLKLLKRLARGPRSATGVDLALLRQLVDLGLARFEEAVGRPTLYAITPEGRHAVASAPPQPGRRGLRTLPNFTVAAMQEAGWRVYSLCSDCGATAWVDLDLAAWRYGARAKLAERDDRCLASGCGGQLSYHR